MGIAAGLSDGGAELRGGALASCQADGAWPATAKAQVAGTGLRPKAKRGHAAAVARAARASARMRSTMERNPLERCGVRCSRRPKLSNNAIASAERISRAGLFEYIANRMAMSPRTIW